MSRFGLAITPQELNIEPYMAQDETGAAAESEPEETTDLTEEEIHKAYQLISSIMDNVETAIIGKRQVVGLVLVTLLARGHVLLEDVPGVGKTSLIYSIARSIDCDFKRIQFTPDLMPSDITGFSIYNQKTGEFEFRPGAVMSNLVLADETNRASAKTQAALLEAMEEKQVTVDSVTYKMEEPFMVMATQNPVESFGTYPLPEAQIDRFMMKLSIGYPSLAEEQKIVHIGSQAKNKLEPVVSKEQVLWLRDIGDRVWVDPAIERYIVEIVNSTRHNSKILLGSSPRGSLALYAASKVYALFQDRGYVIPDDIKFLAPYVLGHRIMLTHEAKTDEVDPLKLITETVNSIAAPK
ncbi:MAG: AAA family ATPase [Anaerovoracaceae bacterium]|jgi:MoxR-like ATPase